jgi:hypothetical protein
VRIAACCQLPCHAGGFHQAGGIGDSSTGNIVGRAVCDAGPQKRQANADIHGPQAGQQLQSDVPLIVIHGHHAIKLAAVGTHKQGVAGQWPRGLDSFRLRPGHSRLDNRRLFIPE